MILEIRNASNPSQLLFRFDPWPFTAVPKEGERVWWPDPNSGPLHGHVTAVEWVTVPLPPKVVLMVTP